MNNLMKLEEILKDLGSQEQMLTQELKTLPGGALGRRNRPGGPAYYVRYPAVGNRKKEHRQSLSDDQDMIKILIEKKYVETALPIIKSDKEIIARAIGSFRQSDRLTIHRELRKKMPDLDDWYFDNNSDLREWAAALGESALIDYHTESFTVTDASGQQLRSKGELYICSQLDRYGIPYRYEQPIHNVPEYIGVPDFTIIRPYDRKLIYWEHLGMVLDKSYMTKCKKKFDGFEKYGIVPWDNLIITYDNAQGGINARLINKMIEAWLL